MEPTRDGTEDGTLGPLTPRPLGSILLTAACLFMVLAAGQILTSLLTAVEAEPVDVRLAGVPPRWLDEVKVFGVGPAGAERLLPRHVLPSGSSQWSLSRQWVRTLKLQMPARVSQRLQGIIIAIGSREYRFSREEIAARWIRHHPPPVCPTVPADSLVVLETPPAQAAAEAPWSPRHYVLNWPGPGGTAADLLVLCSQLWWAVAGGCGFLAVTLATRRLSARAGACSWLQTLLGLREEPSRSEEAGGPSRAGSMAWCLAGLGVLLAVLVRLHLADAYWFTQDDNRVQFLPNWLYGYRAASEGHLATWSPHEHLGTPLVDPGHYSLTYPLTYLSCWIATRLLGDACSAIEVSACLHLVLAYLSTFWLARVCGIGPCLGATSALSFVLSGVFLVLGRMWPSVPALALWLPLTMLPLAALQRHPPGWRWALATGGVIGLSFHMAYTQFWAYDMIFLGLAALVLAVSSPRCRARLRWAVPAGLLGLALAAPLLAIQLEWVGRLHRRGGAGWGLLKTLDHMLVPPQILEMLDLGSFSGRPLMGRLFYSGTVLTAAGLLALVSLVGAAAAFRGGRRLLSLNLWPVCGLAAGLLALGDDGYLWALLSALPGFSMLNNPVKLLPHLTLFLVLSGAISLERLARRTSPPGWLFPAVFALVAGLLAAHADPAIAPYTEWRFPLPYARLEPIAGGPDGPGTLDSSHRIMPVAQAWDGEPDNVWSLSFSLPTWYGLLSVDGYNPLVWAAPENVRVARRMHLDPIGTARAYGVRWFLIRANHFPLARFMDLADATDMTRSRLDSPRLADRVRESARLVGDYPAVQIWELADPDPLAFSGGDPGRALPVSFRHDGVAVDTSSLQSATIVTVNVLWRPAMEASADGRPVPVRSDDWDRVLIEMPAGARRLEVRYAPGWRRGFLASSVLLALAWLAGLAAGRWTDGPDGRTGEERLHSGRCSG